MIGSVFSPYYAWSGRHCPQDYVALNVGLYGGGKKRWTMTERGSTHLEQESHYLKIGPSNLQWDGAALTINIDEWANPIFRKVTGKIRLVPEIIIDQPFQIDAHGNHFWQPLAPISRAEVSFSKPELSWSGPAYMDSNWGSEPLEVGFKNWDWSRAHKKDGVGILYDAFTRAGTNEQLVLDISPDGNIRELAPPSRQHLKKGPIWWVARSTLAQERAEPKTIRMLEDTPFYTRSHIETEFAGEKVLAVHESLDCDRFASNWVRTLLPFRMPRRS